VCAIKTHVSESHGQVKQKRKIQQNDVITAYKFTCKNVAQIRPVCYPPSINAIALKLWTLTHHVNSNYHTNNAENPYLLFQVADSKWKVLFFIIFFMWLDVITEAFLPNIQSVGITSIFATKTQHILCHIPIVRFSAFLRQFLKINGLFFEILTWHKETN